MAVIMAGNDRKVTGNDREVMAEVVAVIIGEQQKVTNCGNRWR